MHGNTEVNITNMTYEDARIRSGEVLAVFDSLVQEPPDQHRPANKKMDTKIHTVIVTPRRGIRKNGEKLFNDIILWGNEHE